MSSKVRHIGHAVSLLGRSRLESIVLSIAVRKTLAVTEVEGFDYVSFWLTAARRACLARLIASALHPATETESFTEGLLLDMGVLLVLGKKQREYAALYQRWRKEGGLLRDLERAAFGYDHAVVGSLVAKEWHLPEHLVFALEYQHDREQAMYMEPAIQLVTLIKDRPEDPGMEAVIEAAVANWQVNEQAMRAMVEEAFRHAEEFHELIDTPAPQANT